MHISDYDYELPKELIAQAPLKNRDASRLMVVDRGAGSVEHQDFRDLTGLLREGDRLVVNDTRVIPARVYGRRQGGTAEIEVLLLNPVKGREGHATFQAMVRPARKLTEGTSIFLGESEVAVEVVGEIDDKMRLLEFPPGFKVMPFLGREGHMPLPPYIQRSDTPEDRDRYQTVFAAHPGAVAAPTAGLHFTPETLERIRSQGVGMTALTLHVGVGTFAPVMAQDPREHAMEREFYRVTPEAADEINATRRAGGRIVAVGTTVVRTLETAETLDPATGFRLIRPGDGWTEKFIYPPYEFQLVDMLVTNFHLPRSTLLMLVTAFGGLELVRRAYREAVHERYRFYSYGDAMVLV